MPAECTIAVVGAGLIGQRHARIVAAHGETCLTAIVDPTEAARAFAGSLNVPWYPAMDAMLAAERPEGIIVATPNRLHLDHGKQAIEAGIPALIEKPIASSVAEGQALVVAADAAGVALLIGHHRRHNSLIQRAKSDIDAGRLGRLVAVHGFFWLYKPDGYFDVAWRREQGAGPILINLIHDIDLLRFLCGEIATVQAIMSNGVRGHDVEDSAVAMLRFSNGALGTVSVSDTIVAPWSWEQTSGENPAYPASDQLCYMIGGTYGSLALPRNEIWSNPAERSWWEPLSTQRLTAHAADPLVRQISHFVRMIRDGEPPLVPGHEGLATLRVIDALQRSCDEGREIALD